MADLPAAHHDAHDVSAPAAKRRAMANLPSWEVVNAMYAEEHPEEMAPVDQEQVIASIRGTGATSSPSQGYKAPQRPVSMPPVAQLTLDDGSGTPEPVKANRPSYKAQTLKAPPTGSIIASMMGVDLAASHTSPSPAHSPASSSSPAQSSSSDKPSGKSPQTYEEYLELSKRMDFTEIRKTHFAYHSGHDLVGRPVVVVCGLIPDNVDPDDLFLFLLDLVDPLADGDYSVVYVVMSSSAGGHKPAFSWLRKVHSTVARKYKKNLKQLFIVHPSFWVKAGFKFFRPFISNKFWKKVVYVEQLRDLYTFISASQVRLPDYVMQSPAFMNGNATFGVTLEVAMLHPMNAGHTLPLIVEQSIATIRARGLQTEGIFRLSGNTGRMKALQELFDKGNAPNLMAEPDIHTITGLLKRYVRELPEPLIPFDLFDTLLAAASPEQPIDIRLATIQALLCELPVLSFKLLDRLIRLMLEIAEHEALNKMCLTNLAIVLAPNIMYSADESMADALSNAVTVNSLVRLFLEQHESLLQAARLKFA